MSKELSPRGKKTENFNSPRQYSSPSLKNTKSPNSHEAHFESEIQYPSFSNFQKEGIKKAKSLKIADPNELVEACDIVKEIAEDKESGLINLIIYNYI